MPARIEPEPKSFRAMNSTRSPDLRVVATQPDADSPVTLRIDAERPLPSPPLLPPAATDPLRAEKLAGAERELDRLHQAANAEQVTLGQHVNWMIASQAVLIHAFLMVFVVGRLGVVEPSRALLGALGLLGIVCALALHGSIARAARTLALLVVQRRAAEMELASLSGRTPNLPKEPSRVPAWTGPVFVAFWVALLAFSVALNW